MQLTESTQEIEQIESLWTALLFIDSVPHPEKTKQIADHLKKMWELASNGDAHQKAIF